MAEQGTHHELLARRGRYWELCTSQLAADRERRLLHRDGTTRPEPAMPALAGESDDE